MYNNMYDNKETMDKTAGEIIDTKMVMCGDGFVFHINRTRRGIIDTINVSYPLPGRVKTLSYKVPIFLGWIGQVAAELTLQSVQA